MNSMTKWMSAATLVIAMAGVLVGCKGDDSSFTKQQEEALRHPQKDPNWKPPGQADMQQEAQSIEAYRKAHANDKVQFTNSH